MAIAQSKYNGLTRYLKGQRGSRVPMSFADIERVTGSKLPNSAHAHRAFWSNNQSNNVMTKAWLEAGFRSEQVDLQGNRLVFARTSSGGNSAVALTDEEKAAKLSVFGCLRGTVIINCDLTEPADPGWAAQIADV